MRPVFVIFAVALLMGCAGQSVQFKTGASGLEKNVIANLTKNTSAVFGGLENRTNGTNASCIGSCAIHELNISTNISGNASASNITANATDISNKTLSPDIVKFEKGNITVVYFYSRRCSASEIASAFVDGLKTKYNESVKWFEYDIGTSDGWNNYDEFADAYNLSAGERYVPMAYVGKEYLWGIDAINNSLDKKMHECVVNGCQNPLAIVNHN